MSSVPDTNPASEGVSTSIEDHVGTVEFSRPPSNFFTLDLVSQIVDALEAVAASGCRATIIKSTGRHFCAGAELAGASDAPGAPHLYDVAARIFDHPLPIVAAVQGAAIGGGFGLALAADFRIASPAARFSANFARLGFHHGFAMSVTLPAIAGQQAAMDLFYTGRRIDGAEALRMGVCDRIVEPGALDQAARELARDIAASAPLAVQSIRRTLRGDLAQRVREAMAHERKEQAWLMGTADFREGVAATAERRPPAFTGQ
jgi:2-(1,2-epoxy-1,2-dihydrophenyl)acetyl-CoA isomerase